MSLGRQSERNACVQNACMIMHVAMVCVYVPLYVPLYVCVYVCVQTC